MANPLGAILKGKKVGMALYKAGKEALTGKKVGETITSVKPGSDTGAKSVSHWKNKASAARIKGVSTDIQALAHKTASIMGRLGSKEKRVKWYQKAADKKKYSDDFYKGRKTKHYYKD